MRRVFLFLTLALVCLFTASCDRQARSDIQAIKNTLNPYFQSLAEWQETVRDAVCYLEADVYDVLDVPSNDQRIDTALGTPPELESKRLCPNGPGDPDGRPPAPPVL